MHASARERALLRRSEDGMNGHVLLGGVIKLVLVGSVEALADAAVRPESLHGGQQLVGERLRVLHARDHVEHELRIRLHRHTITSPHHHHTTSVTQLH